MPLALPTSEEWQSRCAADGEFMQAARHWDGGLRFRIGDATLEFFLDGGEFSDAAGNSEEVLEYAGDAVVWRKMLAKTPARFYNDLMAVQTHGLGITRRGDNLVHSQYFAAAMRALELLRPPPDPGRLAGHDAQPQGRLDAPVGRYVHVQLAGQDHRIYFEEAGEGIPLLLQHTAGAHGSQWRHLFEIPEITRRFRLIAYDLPFHGKSLPPVSRDWWEETYNLKGDFLRALPVNLSRVLGLERPVFMGCSVGGLLALDLAHKHPEDFRAVISVEGALKIAGNMAAFEALHHPRVSNEYKARLMDGLMAPTSPGAYRKETTFVYACGWPPAFLGDLYYYIEDFDLTDRAHEIDTNRVGVHILSGEYDYSGTSELGRAARDAIKGSTWAEMKGVGHFPMCENPEVFLTHLLPILNRIAD